jgi:phospholipid/cholesterol/gamma-HCH transport system substrate-binding protein
MHLTRRIRIQLAILVVVALIAGAILIFGYIRVPRMIGAGFYSVTVQLPEAGGLYRSGNVTYLGTEVGRVTSVDLTDSGVAAVLSLKSGIDIPSDVDAQVHSQSAVGEQYVALLPRNGDAPPLKDGDVIPVNRTSVPPDINELLDATNVGLQAIPRDNLKTAIDESFTAVGGLGPDLSRLVKGSTSLAKDARANLDPLLTLIDQTKPILDTQTDTSDAVQAWAAHLAVITGQLRDNDSAVQGILHEGPAAADEARALFDRLQPTLPVLLANLVSVGQVAVTYHASIEQLLVLLPKGVENMQAISTANRNSKQDYRGAYLDFNLNLNLPPVCNTGYLPAQQVRSPTFEDAPDRPPGDLYCRIPQDSTFNVRGARNYPCVTRPGKRAATVKLCESDEDYVPLNDGYSWKGDPNATLSGQGIPQLPPDSAPAAPAPPPPTIATAQYDPATGSYLGPDGHVHTQADLAATSEGKTWQSMLISPTGH